MKEGEKIFDKFFWSKVLQEQGDGGKVVICRRRKGGSPKGEHPEGDLVLKMKAKATMNRPEDDLRFRNLHKRLLAFPPHPCVVRLLEVYEDDRFFYTVMPRANGGALITGLLQHFSDGNIPADKMKALMRDILDAVGHVHSNGMLHRDIKPDNLVLQLSQHDDIKCRKVMLIDFDHADPDWHPSIFQKCSTDFVGTPRFAAPDVFQGQFSQQSDLYSVGAVLYLLVAGKLPYADEVYSGFWDFAECNELQSPGGLQAAARRVFKRMAEAPPDFSLAAWTSQPACRELCEALLDFSPHRRSSCAKEALLFPWFLNDAAV